MARHAANQLRIDPLPNGRFLLQGYILGQQVRKRSKDFNALAQIKADKERELAQQNAHLANIPAPKTTRLTQEQIADAEAALQIWDGRLVEAAEIAKRHAPPRELVSCEYALTEWTAALNARKRSVRTVPKNKGRIMAFLKITGAESLRDITPAMIEGYVFRPGAADLTRLTDAQVLRAWLNFCCAPARRWLAANPFQIDMVDLSATARPKEKGRILTPAQCHALLKAAREHAGGKMVPYCILVTWLFMRDSEAQRIARHAMKLDGKTPIVEVDTQKRRTVRYRNVTVPKNVLPILRAAVKGWEPERLVPFSRNMWASVREKAGLIVRGKTTRGKRRKIIKSFWQSDITRHSGISYLYQQTGDIREVCRQAGNKTDVSFRHYLTLPNEKAADRFYAKP